MLFIQVYIIIYKILDDNFLDHYIDAVFALHSASPKEKVRTVALDGEATQQHPLNGLLWDDRDDVLLQVICGRLQGVSLPHGVVALLPAGRELVWYFTERRQT